MFRLLYSKLASVLTGLFFLVGLAIFISLKKVASPNGGIPDRGWLLLKKIPELHDRIIDDASTPGSGPTFSYGLTPCTK
jgi:hypothetical protein